MSVADAFVSGKVVDEDGLAPRTAHCTVVTEGTWGGQHGFVSIGSDIKLHADGAFTSPPLFPGRYLLRFSGMLQSSPSASAADRQHCVFDFIYPNAVTVSEALPLDLHAGETMNSVFQIPKPIWFNVAGLVSGDLAARNQRMVIVFQRDMGILGGMGGLGSPIRPDGRFDLMLTKGAYQASIHEMTDPEASGRTRSISKLGSTVVTIEREALNLELRL